MGKPEAGKKKISFGTATCGKAKCGQGQTSLRCKLLSTEQLLAPSPTFPGAVLRGTATWEQLQPDCFFFFLSLQCSAIIIPRKVLKALNAELYLPFLTGSLAHSHQTKDNGKCLNFALAQCLAGQ